MKDLVFKRAGSLKSAFAALVNPFTSTLGETSVCNTQCTHFARGAR